MQRSSDLFTATFFLHNLLSAEHMAWLAQWKSLGLTDAQAQALVYARSAGHITTPTFVTWLAWKPWRPAPSYAGCATMACLSCVGPEQRRSGCRA